MSICVHLGGTIWPLGFPAVRYLYISENVALALNVQGKFWTAQPTFGIVFLRQGIFSGIGVDSVLEV
jgi:hypothetical protein